jgi:multisubunit Na+/H+ antiporter MnhF subunit
MYNYEAALIFWLVVFLVFFLLAIYKVFCGKHMITRILSSVFIVIGVMVIALPLVFLHGFNNGSSSEILLIVPFSGLITAIICFFIIYLLRHKHYHTDHFPDEKPQAPHDRSAELF